jgi:hypothetical protein
MLAQVRRVLVFYQKRSSRNNPESRVVLGRRILWPSDDLRAGAESSGIHVQALNKGEKPPIIADRIEVKELNMGTIVRCSLGSKGSASY